MFAPTPLELRARAHEKRRLSNTFQRAITHFGGSPCCHRRFALQSAKKYAKNPLNAKLDDSRGAPMISDERRFEFESAIRRDVPRDLLVEIEHQFGLAAQQAEARCERVTDCSHPWGGALKAAGKPSNWSRPVFKLSMRCSSRC